MKPRDLMTWGDAFAEVEAIEADARQSRDDEVNAYFVALEAACKRSERKPRLPVDKVFA